MSGVWILVRAAIALVAWGVRVWTNVRHRRPDGDIDGIPKYVRQAVNKRRVTRLDLGLALASPVVFRLTPEGRLDRFFKRIGACEEIQTGDSNFDPRVYIACDHPWLADRLRGSDEARHAILSIFAAGFERIWTDGQVLWMRIRQDRQAEDEFWRLLGELRASVAAVESQVPESYRDPFLWKALVVEGLTWAIGGYAIASFVENASQRQDYHVDPFSVVWPGLVTAVVLLVALLLLIRLLLQRSSRGHRIVVESALVLAFGLPIAGMQLVSDLNRGLDRSPSTSESRTIARAVREEHRGRRGSTYYTYHLYLVPNGRPPDDLEVPRDLYERAAPNRELVMELGPGWLGLPWYRRLSVR